MSNFHCMTFTPVVKVPKNVVRPSTPLSASYRLQISLLDACRYSSGSSSRVLGLNTTLKADGREKLSLMNVKADALASARASSPSTFSSWTCSQAQNVMSSPNSCAKCICGSNDTTQRSSQRHARSSLAARVSSHLDDKRDSGKTPMHSRHECFVLCRIAVFVDAGPLTLSVQRLLPHHPCALGHLACLLFKTSNVGS